MGEHHQAHMFIQTAYQYVSMVQSLLHLMKKNIGSPERDAGNLMVL